MDIYKKIYELKSENAAFATATVVAHKGSAPGKTGFKIVVDATGNSFGTVGGGAIEKEVIEESQRRMKSGQSGMHTYLLAKDGHPADGITVVPMSCAGEVTIFYDVQAVCPTVYVFGGGHVGQALLYHLKPLGFHTVLIDNRETFAKSEINPNANSIILEDYEKYASTFIPANGSFVCILTHGHQYDSKILNILFGRKLRFPYIGIIASKTKAAGLLKKVHQVVPDADTASVFTPVGLKIGGNSAGEIGLAIAAEIQSVRYNKKE